MECACKNGNLSCKLADHIITTNNSYKKVEISRGNVSEDRISIVRNGPNNAYQHYVHTQKASHQTGVVKHSLCGCHWISGWCWLLNKSTWSSFVWFRKDGLPLLYSRAGDALSSLKSMVQPSGLSDYVSFLAGKRKMRLMITSTPQISV